MCGEDWAGSEPPTADVEREPLLGHDWSSQVTCLVQHDVQHGHLVLVRQQTEHLQGRVTRQLLWWGNSGLHQCRKLISNTYYTIYYLINVPPHNKCVKIGLNMLLLLEYIIIMMYVPQVCLLEHLQYM